MLYMFKGTENSISDLSFLVFFGQTPLRLCIAQVLPLQFFSKIITTVL